MFVLLKVLLFLFRPVIWTLGLFLYALLTKNAVRKRRALAGAFAVLIVFTNPFLIRQLMAAYEQPVPALPPSQKFGAGILLGGMVAYNAREDKGYFNTVSDRFIQTALLYKEGRIGRIIVAAGNGYLTKNDFSEAAFIKQKLVTLGVPPEAVLTDGLSKNTLQNAQNAKRIADTAHLTGPHLLISSALHLPRATKVFRKTGLDVIPYPCDFISKETRNNFFEDGILPSSRSLVYWDNLLKEWVGITAYAVLGKG